YRRTNNAVATSHLISLFLYLESRTDFPRPIFVFRFSRGVKQAQRSTRSARLSIVHRVGSRVYDLVPGLRLGTHERPRGAASLACKRGSASKTSRSRATPGNEKWSILNRSLARWDRGELGNGDHGFGLFGLGRHRALRLLPGIDVGRQHLHGL